MIQRAPTSQSQPALAAVYLVNARFLSNTFSLLKKRDDAGGKATSLNAFRGAT
jgi:hypothetical protein